MQPPFGWKLKPVVFAFFGLFAMAAYFFLFAQSRLGRLIDSEKTKAELLAQAEALLRASPVGGYELKRDIELKVEEDLARYVQLTAKEKNSWPLLPLGRWEFTWQNKDAAPAETSGPVRVNLEGEKKGLALFSAEYDFTGKLVGMQLQYPGLKDSLKLNEAQARARAAIFLRGLQIDTSAFTLSQKKATEEDRVSKFEFTFTRVAPSAPELKENLTIEVSRDEVTNYKARVEVDPDKFKQPKSDKIGGLVFLVAAVVTWVTICAFLLVILFKRIRHDELEFQRAFWIGGLGAVLTWGIIAVQSYPEWQGILLGGFFSAIFVGGSLLLLHAVSESVAREVWPEKLELSDLAFRGIFRVREIGAAVFHAFFLAGASLLLYGLGLWLASHLSFSYFHIDNDNLWPVEENLSTITELLGTVVNVGFVTFLFFCFWSTYLRAKIKSHYKLIGLLVLSFSLMGFNLHYLRPAWLAYLFFVPVACLWARTAYEQDLLTILLGVLVFLLVFDFSIAAVVPKGLLSLPALATFGVLALLLVTGALLSTSARTAKDYENYVPAYVSRIAERERFLKELEIARNVQMRFLPASVPSVPRLELASICRPAMEVGGDYFDFIPHDGKALSVLIGDVSGKGVSAAFYMTLAKGIVKTLVRKALSPKQVLAEMNVVFYENSPKEVFISLIYGYFDLQQNTLTFARAGHNPLIVHKSVSGAPQLLNPKGLAIGMDAGAVFAKTIEEMTMTIAPGDLFVFYTDGISECMNKNGEEFGEDRLSDFISQNAHEPAQALLDKITQEISQYSTGTLQHDDFTMVVVKVRG